MYFNNQVQTKRVQTQTKHSTAQHTYLALRRYLRRCSGNGFAQPWWKAWGGASERTCCLCCVVYNFKLICKIELYNDRLIKLLILMRWVYIYLVWPRFVLQLELIRTFSGLTIPEFRQLSQSWPVRRTVRFGQKK